MLFHFTTALFIVFNRHLDFFVFCTVLRHFCGLFENINITSVKACFFRPWTSQGEPKDPPRQEKHKQTVFFSIRDNALERLGALKPSISLSKSIHSRLLHVALRKGPSMDPGASLGALVRFREA